MEGKMLATQTRLARSNFPGVVKGEVEESNDHVLVNIYTTSFF